MLILVFLEKMVDAYFAIVPRKKPALAQAKAARLIAHRGAHNNSQSIFENTQKAFSLAKEVGCWGIEFDIQTTADKVLVVNHDPTLKRIWGHEVAISSLTFQELRELVPQIPSLAEVIAEYGHKLHLFIEIKAPFSAEDSLIENLKGLEAIKDYHIICLSAPTLEALKKLPKEVMLLVALHTNVRKFCNITLKEHYGGLLGSYLLLTDAVLKRVNEANQISGVGLVNSRYSLYRELTRGVKLIFTNKAVEVSRELRSLQEELQPRMK